MAVSRYCPEPQEYFGYVLDRFGWIWACLLRKRAERKCFSEQSNSRCRSLSDAMDSRREPAAVLRHNPDGHGLASGLKLYVCDRFQGIIPWHNFKEVGDSPRGGVEVSAGTTIA